MVRLFAFILASFLINDIDAATSRAAKPGISCEGRKAIIRYPGMKRAYPVQCATRCIKAKAVQIGGRTVFQSVARSPRPSSEEKLALVLHGSEIPSWTAFCDPKRGKWLGLNHKVNMVANLISDGYRVVSPQTAWGDERRKPGQRWMNQWRSAQGNGIDLWTTSLQDGASRCGNRIAGSAMCTDREFFNQLFQHYQLQDKQKVIALIGFSSGGYMVSRLIEACISHDPSTRLHNCPQHFQAAVINSAGYWKCPHNGLPVGVTGGSIIGCPAISRSYRKASPPTLLLWGTKDHAATQGKCCVSPEVPKQYYQALPSKGYKETTNVGHQWLPFVASGEFIQWLNKH